MSKRAGNYISGLRDERAGPEQERSCYTATTPAVAGPLAASGA